MRLYVSEVLPTTPDLLTVDDWRKITIDRQLRLSLGIIDTYHFMFNQFELNVWALENRKPLHPLQQKVTPFIIPNPGTTPPYLINYRNTTYTPGTAPQQSRRTVRISGFVSIFTSIPQQDLADILDKTVPGTDTTGFTTQDYYEHIIRDGGGGPQVRELLIDGRDLGF